MLVMARVEGLPQDPSAADSWSCLSVVFASCEGQEKTGMAGRGVGSMLECQVHQQTTATLHDSHSPLDST